MDILRSDDNRTHIAVFSKDTASGLPPPTNSAEMSANRRLRPNPSSDGSESADSGILNERILLLIFESIKWDLHTLCRTASVNQKLRAVAKRLLWRELCVYRAPRMVAALTSGAPNGRIGGGWDALAKLMFYCCGCQSTKHFRVGQPVAGHFVEESRFSKTSGRSFLSKKCRGDMLYVSDPCEHRMGDMEDDLGVYRGVFQGFMRSRTRACLIRRQVDLEQTVRCPYCGARVWSMTAARLIPKSASRRLGSHDGGIEYFVCVNGHLYGACWLVPLSSDENDIEEDNARDEDGAVPSVYDFLEEIIDEAKNNKMRQTLDARLDAAVELRSNHGEGGSRIKKTTAEGTREFKVKGVIDGLGRVVDMLPGEISVRWQDINLPKEKFDANPPLNKFHIKANKLRLSLFSQAEDERARGDHKALLEDGWSISQEAEPNS
ncbi:hypothetical protein L6164_010121 [Bauhinia variegata]|uniref:Uncharacterized protein n=1 Tax=Bauhinia variegata TaxID=167791 RepID=A0ACB9PLW0_BAUVA|nr:hypothetical protein L6164_010121 [Bauhinia variegata]